MKRQLAAVAAVASAGLMAFGGTPAVAAPADATGTVATYEGRQIDLAKGWQGAQACVEHAVGDVRCYDTAAQANQAVGGVSTKALSDCPSGWVCLWDGASYSGRRLQFHDAGTKKLADWDFRDKTTSAAVNRPQFGVECTDYRTGMPDPMLFLGAASAYSNFSNYDYTYGGSWQNKVDEVKI